MRLPGLVLILFFAGHLMADSDPDAIALLERMDTLYQQDSAHAVMTMEIVTPDYQRTLTMESWSLGTEYALVRVLEPVRDRGIATLKRNNDMWNYLPRVNRTVRVPPSMMMDNWMGSDFTNDDLMRETRWTEEYEVSLDNQADTHVLTLIPREDTVTVWGQMVITIDRDTLLPVSQEYYNEQGTLMRVMTFDDVQTFDGVTLPARMTLQPMNREGQKTVVQYDSLSFSADLSESFFTLQNLRR